MDGREGDEAKISKEKEGGFLKRRGQKRKDAVTERDTWKPMPALPFLSYSNLCLRVPRCGINVT